MSMFRRRRAKSIQPGSENTELSVPAVRGHHKSPSKAETKLEKQALEKSNAIKGSTGVSTRRRLTEPVQTPEDLFLNLAGDDSQNSAPTSRDGPSRSEKIRDRVSRLGRRPTSRDKPEDASSVNNSNNKALPQTPTTNGVAAYPTVNGDAPANSYSDSKLRPLNIVSRAAVGDGPRSAGPALPATTQPRTRQTYRPSSLAYPSGGPSNSLASAYQENGLPSAASTAQSQLDGTESLDSNTAPPSGVWDELEELKTRIRQLELTGGRSKANGEYTDDRPYTATTATTTSLSPQRKQRHPSTPLKAPEVNIIPTELHPVLRSALFKARQVVEPEIYKSLETSANDALEMALLARAFEEETESSDSSFQEEAGAFSRRMKRKADNMCRSLTELCIALCEDKASVTSPAADSFARSVSRPGSQDKSGYQHQLQLTGLDASDYSPLNYIERNRADRAAGKLQSKLLSRNGSNDSRSVLSGSNAPSAYSGRRHSVHRDALSEVSESSHSASRGQLRRAMTTDSREHLSPPSRSRHVTQHDNAEIEDDEDPTIQSPTRPKAEQHHSVNRSGGRAYYTSRHPLPDNASVTSSQVSTRDSIQQPVEYNSSRASLGSQSTITQASSRHRERQERELRAGNVGARLPPSTSADLAERLAQRRQMRGMGSEASTPTASTYRSRSGRYHFEDGSSVTSARTGASTRDE